MIDGHPATVAELWRYPVKSMLGERIDAGDVTEAGITGDRAHAVVDTTTGQVASAKHPRRWGALLQCEARYVEPPIPDRPLPAVTITLPDGYVTGTEDPEVDERLSAVFDRAVVLTTVAPAGNGYLAVWPEVEGVVPDDFRTGNAVDGDEPDGTLTGLALALAAPPGTFFDVAALHVLTTTSLRRLGELEPESRFAVERYRPNVVIDTSVDAFAENGWSGSRLHLGGAGVEAAVLIPTMRCIMTTLAQGQLPRDNAVLRTVARHNRVDIPGLGVWSCVGAYATVTSGGRVQVGDDVTVPPAT